jgi:polyphosphate kinase
VKGLSENIEIISIVDRFLEHSRIYIFANSGNPKYFIGSADWMVRNFDHRFEVITPIYDKNIQEELMDIVKIQLADNVKARYINGEPNNVYKPKNNKEPVRAQFKIYEYLKGKYS